MNLPQQIAEQIRELHFGGKRVGADLKGALEGVTWKQATTQVYSLNTIAKLVFHINYYIGAVLKVFRGGPLDARDKYSYDLPPIRSQRDWEKLLERVWTEAEALGEILDQMPESQLREDFASGKYGDNFQNVFGLINHSYYHLGQIVLIKKIINERPN